MLNQQTMARLQSLGLQGMLRALNRQLDDPSVQKLNFDERFALLLDAETGDREGRKIERLLKAAKMRQANACLEDVDYRASRGIDQAQVASLGDCAWITRRQNLVLTRIDGNWQILAGLRFRQTGVPFGIFRLLHDGDAALREPDCGAG